MDSREQPQPQPQPQQQQQQPPTMMLGPTSYPSMMSPATARFPFNANNHAPPPPPPEPFNDIYNNNDNNNNSSSTCEALKPCGLGSEKKKRGRPRKYSSDGNIALGLAPTTNASSSSAEPSKKHRGRPPGSSKKQMDALGIGGVGFTPHIILADVGEDIAAKLVAFFQQGPRTVCILSATGAVCNVTIRKKPESGEPGVTAALEGPLEILSLSASLQLSENNGGHNRISGLTVSLASPDGQVLGGELVGPLTAATPLQVIVGSFIADGKKSSNLKSGPSSMQPSQLLNFGAPGTPTTPTSQGHSTESSEDNENGHFSKGPGPGPGGPGLYNNASQSIHNMSMYHHHQLWAGQTHQ